MVKVIGRFGCYNTSFDGEQKKSISFDTPLIKATI